MKNILNITLALALVASVSACSQYEQPQQAGPSSKAAPSGPAPAEKDETPADLDARVALPAGWVKENIKPVDCMTPIDSINGAPATAEPYAAGQPATVVGWNVTSSKVEATPSAIYGVLKPYKADAEGAILSGKRVERKDVAGDNKQYTMAGYELAGNMPKSPGKYRFYIWTGAADSIAECDSKVIINIK